MIIPAPPPTAALTVGHDKVFAVLLFLRHCRRGLRLGLCGLRLVVAFFCRTLVLIEIIVYSKCHLLVPFFCFIHQYVDVGIDSQRYQQQCLCAPNEHSKRGGVGVGTIDRERAYSVERQAEDYRNVPCAEASVGGYAHRDAAQHEAHQCANNAEVFRKRKGKEANVELREVAAPDEKRVKQEPALAFHLCYAVEALPQSGDGIVYFLDKREVLAEFEQRHNESGDDCHSYPCDGRCDGIEYAVLNLREGIKKLVECRPRKTHRHKGQRQNGDGVRQAVGHHRAYHFGKRGFLATRDVAAAPHLSEAWKNKIDSIRAEYRNYKHSERRVDAERTQLQTPSHGAEHVAER